MIFQIATIEHKKAAIEAVVAFLKEHATYEEDPTGEDYSEDYDHYFETTQEGKRTNIPFIGLEEGQVTSICFLTDDDTSWAVAEFWVNPKWRKQGVGRRLMDFVMDWCRKDGRYTQMEASCVIGNIPAKSFWNKLGFNTVDKKEFSDRTKRGAGVHFVNVRSL
eukprot:m.68850 g.68850  ORF g.68850 m.68850 type:complete len:163 (+) comp19932_c0_seq1:24-512(+)